MRFDIIKEGYHKDGSLEFTLRISAPEPPLLTADEAKILNKAAEMREMVLAAQKITVKRPNPNRENLHDAMLGEIMSLKEAVYDRVTHDIRKVIYAKLNDHLPQIMTEVRQWWIDSQNEETRNFLREFEPERITYYFDKREYNGYDDD